MKTPLYSRVADKTMARRLGIAVLNVLSHFASSSRLASRQLLSLLELLHVMAMVVCCSCKREVAIDDTTVVSKESRRCKDCHTMRSRIQRLLCRDETLKRQWDATSIEDKQQFLQIHKNLFKENLKKEICTYVAETNKQSLLSKWLESGKFFDQKDLEKRYEGKEDQLKSILEKAPSFHHPYRNVQMWQDVEYEKSGEHKDETITEKKQEVRQNETQKKEPAPRAPKRKAEQKDDGAPEAAPKIKASVTKKISKLMEKLEEVKTGVEVLIDECEEPAVKEEITEKTRTKTAAIKAKLDLTVSDLEMASNTGFNVEATIERATEAYTEANKYKKALKGKVDASKIL